MQWNLADPMSFANRVSCWVVFLVSLMLIGDLLWNLLTDGHFQMLRHSTGLLGLVWVVLFWMKAIGSSRMRLANELEETAASDPVLAEALPRVNLHQLARAEVLLGPRLRNRLLRRQLAPKGVK